MVAENRMPKVMLIEDDQTMVSLLTTLLDLEGFTVATPPGSRMEELLSAIIEERPQIAFVDVNLRLGSGLDLVRQIRQAPGISQMRILMSSGLNLQKECLQAGADGFIQKPYMPDELIKLIRSNVEQ